MHLILTDSLQCSTNDNFGVAKADDSPVVHIINTLASRKRVQSKALKNPMVYVASDNEDDVEVVPNTQPNSP
ncbi:uncharacterized protein PAC_05616 [Phialocephala subalpina]|uniref:Uncharacterized protein n=1 Tax=Phialocephala subalpina TaxID=576137 RepID=A0A1L7WSH4_9HELO|nr:uncharacterized protein PAC_05616 [Phialocephala subalpina]